jgi:primosomal protein N' (replication factor Y)
MLYAKVVLGLPVDGPFDYSVPADLEGKVRAGARVWVNFRNKKEVAYVISLSARTKIKNIKEVSSLIDAVPVVGDKMMALCKELAEYYCCSLGEAIETALPEGLRKGKETASSAAGDAPGERGDVIPLFVQGQDRMPVYLREIEKAWQAGRSAIALFSDIREAEEAKAAIEKILGAEVFLSFRKQPGELEVWQAIRQSGKCVVVGTRSCIFSPVNNLGLVIIDREQDEVYKQEQAPHYHARQAALMRCRICGAGLILGGHALSVDNFYLAQEGKLKLEVIPSAKPHPLVQVIDNRRVSYADRRNKSVFSKFLTDAIFNVLSEKGKVLVFIERRGFATSAACHNCGTPLKCPRCNVNLVFHYGEDKLRCHHCNFKMDVPKICPVCKAGYIKYSGLGTEKLESELARIFPQARVKIIGEDTKDLGGADIFVSTSAVIKHKGLDFDLIGVVAIDNSLNRVDFRAAEKTFSLLMGLSGLTSKRMIIQSVNSGHYCFRALINNNPQFFLKEELRLRKQLNFSPYKHMILIKLRGPVQEKAEKAARSLFENLGRISSSGIKMISVNPSQPAKLRGNFYYQVLMRASGAEKACRFIKLHAKESRYSGIILTVDIDPV